MLLALPRRGHSPLINTDNGNVSLRYEGIDAIERDAIEPFTDLDNIVEIDGSQVRLTAVPEDLIFTS